MRRVLGLAGIVAATVAAAPQASAQTFDNTLLVNTTIPPEFNRDRNVSVTERSRPDYDPLGIRVGSFQVFPRLGVGAGYTDNLYLDRNSRDSAFVTIAPAAEARSDWSVHEVRLAASGVFDKYIGNSKRNQENWTTNALGRLDVTSDTTVTAEGQVSRIFESPLSGDIQSNLTVLSSYLRTYGNLRAQRAFGRLRGTLVVDRTSLDFSRIRFQDDTVRVQRERDRNLLRGIGQVEYGLTPSAAFYGQLSYVDTNYETPLLSGVANRDSHAWRALAGMTLDAPGLVRGRVGLGYSEIHYRAPIYRDIGGLSAEAQIEYFPTELTTFTLRAARTFQDANVGTIAAFTDTRLSVRADHELLRNLLLNLNVDLARQRYIDSPLGNRSWRVFGGGRYLASRTFELNVSGSYLQRRSNGSFLGQDFAEFRLTAGIVLHR